MKKITIDNQYAGERIDKICFKALKYAPKSFVFKMFRKKNIVLNGKKIKGDERCQREDEICFYLSDETFDKFSNGKQKASYYESNEEEKNKQPSLDVSKIIYEDERILIYNKPSGLLSQPNGKADNVVEQYRRYSDKVNGTEQHILDRYGVCNRLDRNTTGLIIIGKTPQALRHINACIQSQQIDKRYQAIVHGHIKQSLVLKGYQIKEEGNKVRMVDDGVGDFIHTVIHPRQYCSNENLTWVEVELNTGKTHQIRHHLSSIGHPIIGDPKYGDEERNRYFYQKYQVKNQLLHSYAYTFFGLDGDLSELNQRQFIAPYPNAFRRMLQKIGEKV